MKYQKFEIFSPAQIDQVARFSTVLKSYLASRDSNSESLEKDRNLKWAEVLLNSSLNPESTAEACLQWSQTADRILQKIADEIFPLDEVAIFAFGKLGSNELNLSSDVDLLIVSQNHPEKIIPLARSYQKRLGDTGDLGFLFRVDYELRPGGRSGPLVSSFDQLEDYYGNYGEVWERMAFIRLRPIWGSKSLIDQVLKFRRKFSFRKHLDYGIFEDLKILRQKVHSHESKKYDAEKYFHLKLGVGGIRDIELFCHALQVIHGGRITELHTLGTSESFERFAELDLLPKADAEFLKKTYWNFRRLENLVQGENDLQTHLLDKAHLKNFSAVDLGDDFVKVDQIVSSLLGSSHDNSQGLPENFDEQKKWLLGLGFTENEVEQDWQNPFAIPVLSRQKSRDIEQKSIFLGSILREMSLHSAKLSPHRLTRLQDFLLGTKAKTSLFSLLTKNPQLIRQVSEVICQSPFLSRILVSRPELLDSLILRNVAQFDGDLDWDEFLESLVEFKQLSEFLIASDFLQSKDLKKLTQSLSALADHIVDKIWRKISTEYDLSDVSVLALGKWGGQELGLFSDLDCVFISSQIPSETALKGLRRFLNRLTEAHRGGSLYSMDDRLRLSGKGSLLISSQSQVQEYLQSKAQIWERQAYLKSRWIGSPQFAIEKLCIHRPLEVSEISELARIQNELYKKKKADLDLKYAEGGILETELAVQTTILKFQIQNCKSDLASQISRLKIDFPDQRLSWEKLLQNYFFFRQVEQLLRLLSEEPQAQLKRDNSIFEQIAASLSYTPLEFEMRLRSAFKEQCELLKILDPRKAQS